MTSLPRRNAALRAGLETYALEIALGVQPGEAVTAAITAAARAHETAVLDRISRAADLVAASLLAEPGGRYRSHAAAITWFAERHVIALPAIAETDSYQPAPGDVIEVTLTGTVLATDSKGTWTLADRDSDRWYRFQAPGNEGAPRIRVLDTAWAAGGQQTPPAVDD